MTSKASDLLSSKWSELHTDLLGLIIDRLNYVEYIRFIDVCADWRSSAISVGSPLLCGAPLLLLPEDDYPKLKITAKYTRSHLFYHSKTCRLFSLCDQKPHKFYCPKLQGRWCVGSLFGWLITVDQQFNIYLFHPLSNAEVQLSFSLKYVLEKRVLRGQKVLYKMDFDKIWPNQHYTPRMWSVPDVKEICLSKVILTSNPFLRDDYKVVAIDTELQTLAYYNMADSSWVSVGRKGSLEDFIYLKDRLYALNFGGDAEIWDFSGASPNMVGKTANLVGVATVAEIYLYKISHSIVEFEGSILQAVRIREGFPETREHRTVGFEVFKLDEAELRWIKISSIGDKAMFLGQNHSFCVLASDYPCCRRNCIYFTDFYWDYNCSKDYGGFDNGVYCLETDVVEPLYDCGSSLIWPPPIWLTPSY